MFTYCRIVLLLYCLIEWQACFAQDTERTHVKNFEVEFPYTIILPSGKTRPDAIPDSIFYDKARGIIFPVNIFNLPKDDPWFHELRERVYPWVNKHDLELKYIEMRGASSPEGPIKWNNTLATNRSKALVNKLQEIFHVNYALVDSTVIGNPEDYKALLFMMKQKNDPDYALVKGILDKHNGNRVTEKAELINVNGGRLWKRLLKEYYPAIRYARVMLYFAPTMSKPTIVIEPVDSIFKLDDKIGPVEIELIDIPTPDVTEMTLRVPRKHLLAVRTNLIYDLLYFPKYGMAHSPNIQLEYYPNSGRFTYNASLTYPDWEHYDEQRFWQIHDYNFGIRCYTRKNKVTPKDAKAYAHVADYFQGLYIGAYVNAGRYGIGFDEKTGWEGEHIGGGLQIGYTLPLCRSSRWRLEFSLGAGVLVSKYDPYVWGNPINGDKDGLYYYEWYHSAELFKKRNHHFIYFGPTELGIHLTYDILYRRQAPRKGVSVNRWAPPTH